MNSIVRQLQRDILESKRGVTELLRTAKVISAKLDLDDISHWVDCELKGYRAEMPPSYRKIGGGNLQILNPVQGWVPAGHVDEPWPVFQPVTELEELAKGEALTMPLKNHYPIESLSGSDNWETSWPQQLIISNVPIKRIIEAVKEELLNWTIELEKRGILGENMEFGNDDQKAAVNQIFNIQKVIGVAGNVCHSTVQVADYSSIHALLKEHGVPQDQRNELENIMDEMHGAKSAEKSNILEKAKGWVVKNKEILGASAEIVRKALGLGSE